MEGIIYFTIVALKKYLSGRTDFTLQFHEGKTDTFRNMEK
jgi:hypothetical protein